MPHVRLRWEKGRLRSPEIDGRPLPVRYVRFVATVNAPPSVVLEVPCLDLDCELEGVEVEIRTDHGTHRRDTGERCG